VFGVEGGAGVVAYLRVRAVQVGAEVGAEQPDRTVVVVPLDDCVVECEDRGGEPDSVHGSLVGVFQQAPGQVEGWQVCVAGDQALLQQAAVELECDSAGDVFQIEPAGDAGSAQPYSVRVGAGANRPRRMSRTTDPRTVRDLSHERIAVSSTVSFPARSSTAPRSTCSTSARSTAVSAAI
jgi:hypothetical protein